MDRMDAGICLTDYLSKKLSRRKAFVWGTGKCSVKGEMLLEYLNVTEWNYIDKEEIKQKNGYKNKKVFSLQEALETEGSYICIAVLHSDSLANELKSNGLHELDDFISVVKCEAYESFLKSFGGASYFNLIHNLDIRNFGEPGYGFSVCCAGYSQKESILMYSFGIGENISFSQDLANKYDQVEIYAFDPTPRAIKFMNDYDKKKISRFKFFEFGLSDVDGVQKFFLPKNRNYVSGSAKCNSTVNENDYINVQMYTLKKILELLGHNHIDLLKMDIEGSEFTVLPQLLKDCISIEQICVELHDRLIENGDKERKVLLELLQESGYVLIYMSETGEELTFIKEEKVNISSAIKEKI